MSFGAIPRSNIAGFLTALLALVLLPGAAAATTLALRPGADLEQPEFEIIANDAHGVRLAIHLPAVDVQPITMDGETFQTVLVEGGQLHGEGGEPALPAFTRYVSIPATSGLGLRIVSWEEETLEGYRIVPMQDPDATSFQYDRALYARDEFLGGDPVTIGAPTLLRDLRVVPVTLQPVRYNPATGEVRIIRSVEIALEYVGVDLRNMKQRASVPLTPSFDRLYRSLVINYDSEQMGRESGVAPHLGTYVLISRDNPQVEAILQPLIEWRSRMGFRVVHATTAETGTSNESIRDWLQDAYNTWEYPPDYICLVGDATGTFSLPTFYETWTYYHGEGDHPYCQLTGDDLMPDAFIGRLSAEDTTTLERIVYKITMYEQTPHMDTTDWFTSVCLTGDTSSSGPTCVQIMQWMKERQIELGYTRIDTVFTSPYESQTINSLNQGRSYFAYRGWLNMSGISAGDISSLQNGPKLTFAIILTCGTGSWASSTARSEAWIRGGSGTNIPTSGIGGVGTATTGTHTRYNNCFMGGMAQALFWEGNDRFGESHARGKLEMILNYEQQEYTAAGRYCYWNTLIADPATRLWSAVPADLVVLHPQTLPVGSNTMTVTVRDEGGQPVAGAWVYLSKEDQIRIGGYTNDAGVVELPIDTSAEGELSVVVTGRNLYPYQGTAQIQEVATFVGLDGFTVDDGSSPPLDGNGDAQANPGETIGLYVSLRNFGTTTAEDVTLTISSDDPYLTWLSPDEIFFGDIMGQQTMQSPDPVILRVYPGTPPGHVVSFDLVATSGLSAWSSNLEVPVSGPDLAYEDHLLYNFGTMIDPGEAGELEIVLRNNGPYAGQGPITATLASDNYAIQVTDAQGSYGTILPGAIGSNAFDRFGVYSPAGCIPGQLANLRLFLVYADGVRETVHFTIPVGQADSNDPTGPDAYGYYCYDDTDTGYAEAPTYQWIDINPSSGGPGTSVGLGDFGTGQDDTRTLDLPFTFTFYGQTFDRVSVCSNGWMAMGNTYLENYRNWHLPSANGPGNMIAGFWDNIYQTGNNKVYYWHDAAQHRFIVAWDRLVNVYGGGAISFEIILYDPAYYPTSTGDGIIEVMYELIQDTDTLQMYSTAGIQNADRSTGLTFSYYHTGPATAASFTSGRALRYTTGAPGFSGLSERDGRTHLILSHGPNPWSRSTTIRFQLAQPLAAKLRVFDLDGRLVRTLVDGVLSAGPHSVDWSGDDAIGAPLPSGVYYYKLETAEETATRRMLLIR